MSASGVPYAPIAPLPSHSIRPGGSCVRGVDERPYSGYDFAVTSSVVPPSYPV